MVPRTTTTASSTSEVVDTPLIGLDRELKHVRVAETLIFTATCVDGHGSNPNQGGEVSTALRHLGREIVVPVTRSPRKSVLWKEDMEEVLERSCFVIRLRQDGQAEACLGLIIDSDHRGGSSWIPTIQEPLATTSTRKLLRTLLKYAVRVGSIGKCQ